MQYRLLSLALSTALLLGGCTTPTTPSAANAGTSPATVPAEITPLSAPLSPDALFTDADRETTYDRNAAAQITLSDAGSTASTNAVLIQGNTVTITDEGTYVVRGSLTDGSLVVRADKTDKVRLVLDGVSIASTGTAPLYIAQADKVFVMLSANSQNTLDAPSGFVQQETDVTIDAALFSRDDLTLSGTGHLSITSPGGHGMVSKDDLRITGGTYLVNAASHGITGKDALSIADGQFTITAGNDGLHAENKDDTTLGNLYIGGGQFTITAAGDGISASAALQIEDGSVTVQTGGGTAGAATLDQATSAKGIKGVGTLYIGGGTLTADCADDSLHTNGNLIVHGGTLSLSSGDDGAHADGTLQVLDGMITVSQSYEALEGLCVEIGGGTLDLTSSDDGINAAGGNDQSGFEGRPARDTFAVNADAYIRIAGGTMTVNAEGDGLDSNGNLFVTGGQTFVYGPTRGGNGTLDYSGDATVTGGTLLAVGTSDMAQNFGNDSTQGAILVNIETQQANTPVTLTDANGQTLFTHTPAKSYSSIVLTCPDLKQGQTYTLSAGAVQNAVTLDTLIYGTGFAMGGGMRGKPGDWENGERPMPPDWENGERPARPDWENGERPARPNGVPDNPDAGTGATPEGEHRTPTSSANGAPNTPAVREDAAAPSNGQATEQG